MRGLPRKLKFLDNINYNPLHLNSSELILVTLANKRKELSECQRQLKIY